MPAVFRERGHAPIKETWDSWFPPAAQCEDAYRFHLSHAHVEKAREFGMTPKKLGKLYNANMEFWKLRLPAFIESIYRTRFGKDGPGVVHSVEERAWRLEQKKAVRREAKRLRREARS